MLMTSIRGLEMELAQVNRQCADERAAAAERVRQLEASKHALEENLAAQGTP